MHMATEDRSNSMFGEKTSKGQLQGGFFLLIAGIVLGVAALILFAISYSDSGDSIYNWRKGALTTGTLALPLLFLGWGVAVPTKTAMRITSFVGLSLCLLATLLFFVHYPNNFNVQDSTDPNQEDYTGIDTLIYSVGLAMMVASIFASLIGYYSGRMVPMSEEGEVEDELYGPGYEVPDWVVERDIEYAMKKYGVSWGSSKDVAGSGGLAVNINDDMGGKIVVGGLGKARTVQLDSSQVDEATAKLGGTRTQKKGSVPSEWTDDSVKKLVAFRKQKQDNPKQYTPQVGFWARMKNRMSGRSAPAPTNRPPPPRSGGRMPEQAPSTGPRRGKTVVIPDEPRGR